MSPNAMTSQATKQGQFSATMMDNWYLVTDQVMGGLSSGLFKLERSKQYLCLHMQGSVTTANNGGFIQIAHDLIKSERSDAASAEGIRLLARGNNESYNLHLRTTDLGLPWQSYRSSFIATEEWREVQLPFDDFSAYKTGKKLDTTNIRRIGLVAIGRDFEADICVADISFY